MPKIEEVTDSDRNSAKVEEYCVEWRRRTLKKEKQTEKESDVDKSADG